MSVSTYVIPKDPSSDDVRNVLGSLVRNFDAGEPATRQQLRDLLESDPALFCRTAVESLKTDGDSTVGQYLVALLVSSGMLPEALCSPSLNREEALSLARSARRVDHMVDLTLARTLAESAWGNTATRVADPVRLVDILCEIADAGRIMPSLMRLMRHPDAYVRAKTFKMVGCGSRSAKWVMGRLSEPDAEARANAIETLWGTDSPEARTLLKFAVSDPDPRVVGNSLLGLYHMGDASVLNDVIHLTAHESSLFRATAAWVMGESRDPRFTEALRRQISDPDASVRKRAFAALGQLKAANSQPPVGDRLHVAGRVVGARDLTGQRRVLVAVESDDMRDQPKVAPLHFLLSEGGQYITSYTVAGRSVPQVLSVVFVIPRSREAAGGAFIEGVMNCLKWKRPTDFWCVLPYIECGDGDPPGPLEPDRPLFTCNAETLAAALRSTPKRLECTDLWTAVWRALKPEAGQSRGRRHAIVLSSAEESRSPDPRAVEDLQSGRVRVKAVVAGQNRKLEDICRQTRTRCRVSEADAIVEAVEQAYLDLLARYEITYQPAAEAVALRVRVQTSAGWGETLIAAPVEADGMS